MRIFISEMGAVDGEHLNGVGYRQNVGRWDSKHCEVEMYKETTTLVLHLFVILIFVRIV